MTSSSFGGEIGVDADGGSRLAIQDGVEDDGGGVAAERHDAGRHLVEHSPEGEEVAAGVEFFAFGLLRRHVRDRAEAVPGLVRYSRLTPAVASVCVPRRVEDRLRARDFGQAEVENLGVSALGHENVGGLDVAMDDAFAVRGVERVGDFDGQAEQDCPSPAAGRRCGASGSCHPETPWR